MTIPTAIVRACEQMIPRLRAEESLLEVQRIGMGSGTFDKRERRRLHLEWKRIARGPKQSTRPATASSVWGGVMHLPGMQLVRVPKKKDSDGHGR